MAYDVGPLANEGPGARRLFALADYLETVPAADYDHRVWRRLREDGGWSMCALGHGVTALPDLIGLRWRTPACADVVRLDGSGVTANALELASEAFEITLDEAASLFGVGLGTVRRYGAAGGFRVGPRQAAAAIRSVALAKLSLLVATA